MDEALAVRFNSATTHVDLIQTQGGVVNEELLKRFVAYVDVKQESITTYCKAVKQFIRYINDNGIEHPKREDVIKYREHLKSYCKPTTVQTYITALRVFFKWTFGEHLYLNIAEHVKGATIDKSHKRDCLTSMQIRDVLNTVDRSTVVGRRDYAMVLLMTTCGLRTIEVSRANREDFRTSGGNEVLYVQGKGKEERTEYVKLAPAVSKALRDYIKDMSKSKALFTSLSDCNKNARLTTRGIRKIVKERLRAVGLNSERLSAHSLRHTAVTLALLNGQSLQETQQFARHSSISTTQIYAHNLDIARNECAEKITRAILGETCKTESANTPETTAPEYKAVSAVTPYSASANKQKETDMYWHIFACFMLWAKSEEMKSQVSETTVRNCSTKQVLKQNDQCSSADETQAVMMSINTNL
jgi:integrase/recombinase XerC